MLYSKLVTLFSGGVSFSEDEVPFGNNFVVRNFSFHSPARQRGVSAYSGIAASATGSEVDEEIQENNNFRYHVMMPAGMGKARNVVIMLHGLNERYWTKYLPWAASVVEATGHAVVLFPLAFHMNRAPAKWADPQRMAQLSRERKRTLPTLTSSSFVNAAISARLCEQPERFIQSGLESYYDLINLVEMIKNDLHPAIDKDTTIDFFTYSIGTLLGDLVMMANMSGYFSASRHVSFCGGPVVSGLHPESKFILDSEAVGKLRECLLSKERLEVLLSDNTEFEKAFRCMLDYGIGNSEREERLRSMGARRYVIALADDRVVTVNEIRNTFKKNINNGITVDIMQYTYRYQHEQPFPVLTKMFSNIDRQFQRTFDKICNFLKR
ncbi:DUF6051 family protein [Desulfovibrio sp.]|uniref:DUF6051 family protein n=1 Tax=Desulfovibrio TaxID=872 RepID=UPI0025C3B076|nr:DUF6051 family protein [Desulfovibrio sp.]